MARDDVQRELVEHLKGLPLQQLFCVVAADEEKFAHLSADDKVDVLVHAARRAQAEGAKHVARATVDQIEQLQDQVRELESYAGGFLAFFHDKYKLVTAAAVCALLAIGGYSFGRMAGFSDGIAYFEDQENIRSKFDAAFAAMSFNYLGTLDQSPAPCLYAARIHHPGVEQACVVVLKAQEK